MNIKILMYASFLSLAACANDQVSKIDKLEIVGNDSVVVQPMAFDSLATGLTFIHKENYSKTKAEVKQIRNALKKEYLNMSSSENASLLDSAGSVFTQVLLNEIIPYWYGTVWDFNGYTEVPNKGTIACGYFVSTTLRDMDLQLNRYKLAQQTSLNEVNTFAFKPKSVLHFSGSITEELLKLDEGVYIVGLDNHVGYIYRKDKQAYFIHSDYIRGKVVIELATESSAFESHHYYIISLSDNHQLLEKWLLGERIKVVLD